MVSRMVRGVKDNNSSGSDPRWWQNVEDTDQYAKTASWLYSTGGQAVVVVVVIAVVAMMVLNLFGIA